METKTILRSVRFSAREGLAEALRELMVRDVVPMNRRFGCLDCYVLHAAAAAQDFAIVSVWRSAGELDAMRVDPAYVEMATALKNLTASGFLDTIYEVMA